MHQFESGLVPARGGRLQGFDRLADKLGGGETAAWDGEIGAAEALRKLNSRCDRIVSYVGKLIRKKRALDLLLARPGPFVVARLPEARLVVVGVRDVPGGAWPRRGRAWSRGPGDAA